MGAQKVAWSQNRAPNTGITCERVDEIRYLFIKKNTLEDPLPTGSSAGRVQSNRYFESLHFPLVTLKVQLRMAPFYWIIVHYTLEKNLERNDVVTTSFLNDSKPRLYSAFIHPTIL